MSAIYLLSLMVVYLAIGTISQVVANRMMRDDSTMPAFLIAWPIAIPLAICALIIERLSR